MQAYPGKLSSYPMCVANQHFCPQMCCDLTASSLACRPLLEFEDHPVGDAALIGGLESKLQSETPRWLRETLPLLTNPHECLKTPMSTVHDSHCHHRYELLLRAEQSVRIREDESCRKRPRSMPQCKAYSPEGWTGMRSKAGAKH
jgi:hypothetical protein